MTNVQETKSKNVFCGFFFFFDVVEFPIQPIILSFVLDWSVINVD